MTDFITPSISADDIYTPEKRDFVETVPGSYRMTPKGPARVKKSKAGNLKVELFFIHTSEQAKTAGYKGLNFAAMLDGTDKNGKPLARQFGELLQAFGFSKEAIIDGKASVLPQGDLAALDTEEGWKGVPASITINGDAVNLEGKEVIVKVEASTYNGKTTNKAVSVYAL